MVQGGAVPGTVHHVPVPHYPGTHYPTTRRHGGHAVGACGGVHGVGGGHQASFGLNPLEDSELLITRF